MNVVNLSLSLSANITCTKHRACVPATKIRFIVFVIVSISVILAVFYLSTGFVGCLIGPGISCGARKLTWTPRVTKKKKKYIYIYIYYMHQEIILHKYQLQIELVKSGQKNHYAFFERHKK